MNNSQLCLCITYVVIQNISASCNTKFAANAYWISWLGRTTSSIKVMSSNFTVDMSIALVGNL